jgi:hypothetical protein
MKIIKIPQVKVIRDIIPHAIMGSMSLMNSTTTVNATIIPSEIPMKPRD